MPSVAEGYFHRRSSSGQGTLLDRSGSRLQGSPEEPREERGAVLGLVDGAAFYVAVGRPCARCGHFRKRTRDRSCYRCHLAGGGENFERIKAGISPEVTRSQTRHLDLLERKRAEQAGEFLERHFDGLIAKRWPTGRLEITLPDGTHDHDLSKRTPQEIRNASSVYPQLRDAVEWAGWTLWPED